MTRRVVDVLVPVALDHPYSYRVPDKLALAPGDVVSVPLGARETTAVVWAENPKPNPRLDNRLKDVEEKLDVPPLKPELRSFVDWVANYTVSSRGMVLRMCLRMGEHLGAGARAHLACKLVGCAAATHDRGAGARARTPRRRHDARQRRGGARGRRVSAGVVDGLIDEGTLETVVLPPEPVAAKPDPGFHAAGVHAPSQRAAADALKATIAKGGYSVTLLDGVTGSGKTEVYFEAVADTIRAGRQTPDPDAGDRAHRAIPRPLRGALRHPPGGMAFGAHAAQARPHLGGRRQRRSLGRGRRALGAVPALCRSRADHRR